jgi:hypothetical protein
MAAAWRCDRHTGSWHPPASCTPRARQPCALWVQSCRDDGRQRVERRDCPFITASGRRSRIGTPSRSDPGRAAKDRHHGLAETFGRPVIRDGANATLQVVQFVESSLTDGTTFEVRHDACRVDGAQLVIHVRIDQAPDLVTRHDAPRMADARYGGRSSAAKSWRPGRVATKGIGKRGLRHRARLVRRLNDGRRATCAGLNAAPK